MTSPVTRSSATEVAVSWAIFPRSSSSRVFPVTGGMAKIRCSITGPR
jgi:hypothetical protein